MPKNIRVLLGTITICEHSLVETKGYTDDALLNLLEEEPTTCFKIDWNQDNIRIVHGFDTLTASKDYVKGVHKIFLMEEDISQQSYYNILNKHYSIGSGKEPDELFEGLVDEEIKELQQKEYEYKQSKKVIKAARTETEIYPFLIT